MMVGNILSWLPGLIWMSVSGQTDTPSLLYTTFVSVMLLIWPVFYIYANYRGVLGALERIARQSVVILGFSSFGTILLIMLALIIGKHRGWSASQVVANAFIAVFLLLMTAVLYRPFENFVNWLLYGRLDVAIDELTKKLASDLAGFSDLAEMERYVLSFCEQVGIQKTAVYILQEGGFRMLFARGDGVKQEEVKHLGNTPRHIPAGGAQPEWVRMVLPMLYQDGVRGYWLCGERDEDDFYSPNHLVKMQYIVSGLAAGLQINQQRQQNQQQLEVIITQERMAALGRMSASIAHQINNPLQVVMGALGAYTNYAPNDEIDPYLRMAKERTAYLGEVVKSITMFTRPSAGQQQIVDVNDSVHKAILLSGQKLADERIQLQLQLGAHVQARVSSPSDLVQVVTNIVDNAYDALRGRQNGCLHIETIENGAFSIIRIADNGAGMSNEQKARMFEPFFTTKPTGSGFGLSVAYSIIERNGGRISAESTIDHGSVFTILIPKQ